MLQVWQDWSHVEGLQTQTDERIRSWRRVVRDGMHRNGKHRFACIEIGAVQLLEKDHEIRNGIDSCAAVTVFPKTVADVNPGVADTHRAFMAVSEMYDATCSSSRETSKRMRTMRAVARSWSSRE